MKDKGFLRKLYKLVRNNITESEIQYFDEIIFSKLVNLRIYNDAKTVLIYVSFGSEVDTKKIIDFSLECGKTVAVPFCYGNRMEFYAIKSSDELIPGKYGIPTADITNRVSINDFNDALCIVPALSFDLQGNRLGYGGGYYDRFLEYHSVKTIGLCYSRCIHPHLPAEDYDIKIDNILTERL